MLPEKQAQVTTKDFFFNFHYLIAFDNWLL